MKQISESPTSKHLPESDSPPRARRGLEYVYLIHAVGTYRFKIGRSKDPKSRLQQLSTASPVELRLMGHALCKDAVARERTLHQVFADARRHGEWFELDVQSLPKVAAALKADVGLHFARRTVVDFAPGDTAWISWDSIRALEVEVINREHIWYTIRIKETSAEHFLRLDEVQPDPVLALINRVTL